MNPERDLFPLAGDIVLPPLIAAPANRVPRFPSARPMLRAVNLRVAVRLGAAT